jgi:DNA-binding response OmpR family regulator
MSWKHPFPPKPLRPVRILVVTADYGMAERLGALFRGEGHDVTVVHDRYMALMAQSFFDPTLIVLHGDLFELREPSLARALRSRTDVPILVLWDTLALDAYLEIEIAGLTEDERVLMCSTEDLGAIRAATAELLEEYLPAGMRPPRIDEIIDQLRRGTDSRHTSREVNRRICAAIGARRTEVSSQQLATIVPEQIPPVDVLIVSSDADMGEQLRGMFRTDMDRVELVCDREAAISSSLDRQPTLFILHGVFPDEAGVPLSLELRGNRPFPSTTYQSARPPRANGGRVGGRARDCPAPGSRWRLPRSGGRAQECRTLP